MALVDHRWSLLQSAAKLVFDQAVSLKKIEAILESQNNALTSHQVFTLLDPILANLTFISKYVSALRTEIGNIRDVSEAEGHLDFVQDSILKFQIPKKTNMDRLRHTLNPSSANLENFQNAFSKSYESFERLVFV